MNVFAQQDQRVEYRESAEVVWIGLPSVPPWLHDDEGEDVACDTDEQDKRGAKLQNPPAPRLLGQGRLVNKPSWNRENIMLISMCN